MFIKTIKPCRRLRWLQRGLWIIILGSTAFAPRAEESGARLKLFLKKVHSLRAEFHQILLDEHNKPLEKSEGVFFLQRPGKFRWNYREPFSQEIVADGEHLWFYDPDLEQVIVKSQNLALGNTPALLLSGKSLPKESYQINNLPAHNNLIWIELLPRDKKVTFDRLLLGFDNDSLRQMELHDSFGQTTRLSFSNIKINLSLDPSLFIFFPPEGVDVVGDTP